MPLLRFQYNCAASCHPPCLDLAFTPEGRRVQWLSPAASACRVGLFFDLCLAAVETLIVSNSPRLPHSCDPPKLLRSGPPRNSPRFVSRFRLRQHADRSKLPVRICRSHWSGSTANTRASLAGLAIRAQRHESRQDHDCAALLLFVSCPPVCALSVQIALLTFPPHVQPRQNATKHQQRARLQCTCLRAL